jgi:predicted nucleic acid-binding protein
MSRYFLDTSALAKHYHAEVGTATVDAILAESGAEHLISRLAVSELHSLFGTKVRTGTITSGAFGALVTRFMADLQTNKCQVVALGSAEFSEAERLLFVYAPTHGLRTLDALHLATAATLRLKQSVDFFVTADKKLLAVAASERFAVIDPEQP